MTTRLLLCLLLSAPVLSVAQNGVVSLSPKSGGRLFLVKELQVYADTTGLLGLEQIRADSTLPFISGDQVGRPINLAYWVKVTLRSDYEKDVQFRIAGAWWDYVIVYLVYANDSLVTVRGGLMSTPADRHGQSFATIILPAHQSVSVYARLSSSGHFMRMTDVNLMLAPHRETLENERWFLYLAGILVGILVGFSFYNLTFSASGLDPSYVWYFVYLFALAVSFSGQLGTSTSYLTQFFIPDHPLVGLYMKRLSDPVAWGSLIIFSIYFLNTRRAYPRLHWLLVAVVVLEILITAYRSTNLSLFGFAILVHLVAVGAVLFAAIVAYRDGYRVARYFIVGQALVFLGVFFSYSVNYLNLDLLAFLPDHRLLNFIKMTNPFSFGAIEALEFSLALTERQHAKLESQVSQRTKELDESLHTLKAAQSQLIQSEKMASLGELTAGIAHEIKNPLNFVNNFSEVSKELLEEMKQELEKGNPENAKLIANDVIDNLEKVAQHGQRADGIVKSMLQHSRKSTGQRELTDINALCDEYLRLAYHGLRAKDKSFNAKFETHLDPALPKINVVPQDIGRVVLNLINNAFYACTERSRSAPNQQPIANSQQPDATYEPTVIVSTRNLGNKIEISVKDNGTGIPDHIKEKIFQPFFTTKPTGQGTGLGLSLSYDIVKAHGGELTVETQEGQGTTLSIHLPA